MLKPILAVTLFFIASNCHAQTPDSTAEIRDTVQMQFVRCTKVDINAKCKKIEGYAILLKSPAAISCSNNTGTEVVDMQIYLDEQKKVIDRTKFDIFFK